MLIRLSDVKFSDPPRPVNWRLAWRDDCADMMHECDLPTDPADSLVTWVEWLGCHALVVEQGSGHNREWNWWVWEHEIGDLAGGHGYVAGGMGKARQAALDFVEARWRRLNEQVADE